MQAANEIRAQAETTEADQNELTHAIAYIRFASRAACDALWLPHVTEEVTDEEDNA
jgi:hypothetical protein